MNNLSEEAASIVEAIRGKGAVPASLAIHAYIQELKLAIGDPETECTAEELETLRSYVAGLEAAEAILDAAITTGKEPNA